MRDRVIAAVGDVYDVDAELGRGGMAIVYRATDLRLRRRVAVKVLPPELAFRDDVRRRFLREAETAAQLTHPNIVPIYSVDERGGIVYIVMALVEGESLAARLARAPRLEIDETRRILRDVADALACAHAHGVIHRDIKPDNILLERESGRPVVTDFGIARAAEADSRLTVTGVAVGTPAYMSPEQALGERDVDGRSDIYSLGVLGYQMLAGELPFRANNTPSMMMKHISELPRPLRERRPDVPPVLANAIERALAKKPEDRWSSAAEMRDAVIGTRDSALGEHRGSRFEARPFSPAVPSLDARISRHENEPSAEPRVPSPALPLPFPPLPYPMMSRREWRQMYRAQRRGFDLASYRTRPVEERIISFRRHLVRSGAVILMLAGINMLTSPWFPWFLFPAIPIGIGVLREWGNLWAEGIGWRRIFGKRDPAAQPGGGGAGPSAEPRVPSPDDEARKLVGRDILDGAHGAAVRRAVADRQAVLGIVESLSKPDRELLPDVVPTVNALVERAVSIAQTLHHLDADVSSETLARLESRLAEVRRESEESADHDRRLALLERQHASLEELAERRARLAGQLESAGIALQNLKFDLLKLRSSGVQSAIGDVNSATVEARALSREIGHVLDAAAELRKL
jgi:serine/threonine-protein kinase